MADWFHVGFSWEIQVEVVFTGSNDSYSSWIQEPLAYSIISLLFWENSFNTSVFMYNLPGRFILPIFREASFKILVISRYIHLYMYSSLQYFNLGSRTLSCTQYFLVQEPPTSLIFLKSVQNYRLGLHSHATRKIQLHKMRNLQCEKFPNFTSLYTHIQASANIPLVLRNLLTSRKQENGKEQER